MKNTYYKDVQTGETKILCEEKAELFGDLIGAIANEDIEYVDAIMDDSPFLAYAFDDEGFSALHFASHHCTQAGLEIVRILVQYGADPYFENEDGFSAIDNINDITDINLRYSFCDAMRIGHDTQAILKAIVHAKAVAEVEAEYAAKKVEEGKTDSDNSFDSALDEAERYFQRHDVQEMHKTMNKIEGKTNVYACPRIITCEQANSAIEETQSKDKASYLEFPVDEGLAAMLDGMFGTKTPLDDLIGSKEAFNLEAGNRGFFASFGSAVEYLSNQLSSLLEIEIDSGLIEATILQLQGLLTMAGSGSLPIGIPHRHNNDDDFEPNSGGSSNVEFFENPLELLENTYVVTILPNNTYVIADNSQ